MDFMITHILYIHRYISGWSNTLCDSHRCRHPLVTGSEDRFLRFSGARPSAMPSPLSPWDTTAPKASANTQEAPCMLVEEKTQSADANLNSGAKKIDYTGGFYDICFL